MAHLFRSHQHKKDVKKRFKQENEKKKKKQENEIGYRLLYIKSKKNQSKIVRDGYKEYDWKNYYVNYKFYQLYD